MEPDPLASSSQDQHAAGLALRDDERPVVGRLPHPLARDVVGHLTRDRERLWKLGQRSDVLPPEHQGLTVLAARNPRYAQAEL